MMVVSRTRRSSIPKGESPQIQQPGNQKAQPPSAQSAACEKCGALLKPEKSFCTACGAPRQPISKSSAEIRTGSINKLCLNPQCGQPLVTNKKFCTKCGTPVI